MAAPSPVLFALHNSLEPQGFEHLCVDLLVREGHSRIIPGGRSRDHGRDAEVRYWVDSKIGYPRTAFQFSKESKWEPKLRKDISKITRCCGSIEQIVFISSRTITVEKQDKLRNEFQSSHQVTLEILDEGWFRIRLEEDHVDLALKHLGVVVQPTPGFYATQIKLHGLTDANREEILRHRSPEDLRATLTAQTRVDPTNPGAWKGLAHVCFYQSDYESALLYTSKAIRYSQHEGEQWNLIALKASIIAEQGIASRSRLLLKKAKELFAPFIDRLGRSIDHYNLANILTALEQWEDAERHYRKCIELEPNYAQAWHNLGSLLVKQKRIDEGIASLDAAILLKPDLVEALCTKANVLVLTSDDCSQALHLMEQAFSIDSDLELRWPHAHYWRALALCRMDRLREALVIVEDRLERKFDCPFLGRLANDIFAKLWRSDSTFIPKAEAFFALRIDTRDRDYRALIEILDILDGSDREEEAWGQFKRFLGIEELPVRKIAERIPVTIADLTDSLASIEYYRNFRDFAPLADYAQILAECDLHPHDEVPEILFHLLLPSYFRLAATIQKSNSQIEAQGELDVLLETYRQVSRTFLAFGGAMLYPTAPKNISHRTKLMAGSAVFGLHVPLMEVSRLLGFLLEFAGREVPERYLDSLIELTPEVHGIWITDLFETIGIDWGIERHRKQRNVP